MTAHLYIPSIPPMRHFRCSRLLVRCLIGRLKAWRKILKMRAASRSVSIIFARVAGGGEGICGRGGRIWTGWTLIWRFHCVHFVYAVHKIRDLFMRSQDEDFFEEIAFDVVDFLKKLEGGELDGFAIAKKVGPVLGVGTGFEEEGEHVFAGFAGVEDGGLFSEGNQLGGPDGFAVHGAGNVASGGVGVEAALQEFAGDFWEVVFGGQVQEGGVLKWIASVMGVEGTGEGVGVLFECGLELAEGFAVDGHDGIVGDLGASLFEEGNAAGAQRGPVGTVHEVVEGVAGTVETVDDAGGVGPALQEKGDAVGVEAFAGRKEDGAVIFVIEAVGIGTEFDQEVGGVELAEGCGFSEGLISVFGRGIGAVFPDGVEVSGGGGEENRGVFVIHRERRLIFATA